MRFRWLLLSCLNFLLLCSPAEAGRLLFWRFETNQNRLVFTTDAGVQPKAQLIFNPTRVVIDLPGTTLGRPSVNQTVGNLIRSVRVGQFDSFTTRIVIEIAPGYTVDPQQVQIRGISPTQWTVQLPTPQRLTEQPTVPPPTPSPNPQPESRLNPGTAGGTANQNDSSQDFQIARNGLLVRLESQKGGKIEVKRSRDRRRIEFNLEGAKLPQSLAAQKLSLNYYGISEIEFAQTSASPPKVRITLNVDRDSPDWLATFSNFGGVVLFPKGGMSAVAGGNSQPPPNPLSSRPQPRQANIQSLELANNGNSLVIRADGAIQGTGKWNSQSGIYELRIPNAQLANSVRGPQLNRNSPIFRLRLQQEGADTVLVLVQPALSVQVTSPQQINSNTLALPLQRRFASVLPPATAGTPPNSRSLPVTPAPRTWTLPQTTSPSSALPRPNRRVLVVIDPGHGGKDPGTIGIGGVQEKNIILPISQQVAQLLERQGVQVRMTRDADYFVSLPGRTQMANSIGANLFVSIHANAINLSRPDINGLETYYYENGRQLAETIHRSILRSVNVRDRRVRRARFYVLRTSRMPSVLVETGFLTGNEDSPRLQEPGYRSQMAEAIARGILEYIQQNRL